MFNKIEVAVAHELGNTPARVSKMMAQLEYQDVFMIYGDDAEVCFAFTDCKYIEEREAIVFNVSEEGKGDILTENMLSDTENLQVILCASFSHSTDELWSFGEIKLFNTKDEAILKNVKTSFFGVPWTLDDAKKVVGYLIANGLHDKDNDEYTVAIRGKSDETVNITYTESKTNQSADRFGSLAGSIERYLNTDLRGDFIRNICGLNQQEMAILLRD
ncbi:hypothetical protein [Vibrio owensii]|uniref:hypothetical protein n=1 Tax=Vibrio owensii TaxID=696485 RepID=UPI0018F2791B|nr:hypothetical protein [Vibrio owensii]